MLTRRRLMALEASIRSIVRRNIEGDVIECGTARGGSAALIALCLQRAKRPKRIHIFDTFEGLPAPTGEDLDYPEAVVHTGACRGGLEEVQGLFQRLGVFERAVFVKGLFQETLPDYPVPPIALIHLDGDWYESTRTCLEHLWEHLSPGGIVHFDDYGTWQGCKRAVDEFFAERGITERLHPIGRHARWVMKSA